MGSPGMEGHRKDKYDVIAINKNNTATVYSKHQSDMGFVYVIY